MRKKSIITAVLCLFAASVLAQKSNDAGLDLSAEAIYRLNKKANVTAGVDLSTRNDFKTMDDWTVSVGGAYKLSKNLKASAGYSLRFDNNIEKISTEIDGTITKWRPSYWGVRHRFNLSFTESLDWNRFSFSLRERLQYTYRPEKTTDRYNFDNEEWEKKVVRGRGKTVLRTRLQVEYNVPKCKVDPYTSVEVFNAWSLQKTRFTLGADWKISKKYTLGAYYRYQNVRNDDDDNEPNNHILGAEFKFKF